METSFVYSIIYLTAFAIGAALGSFVNMLVWRIYRKESLLGRSYCDNTHEELAAVDLIPVFSYIIFKGKCRKCSERLPILYPVVEFISGLLLVRIFFSYFHPGSVESLVIISCMAILIVLLVFFAVYDLVNWSQDKKMLVIAWFIAILSNCIFVLLEVISPETMLTRIAAGLIFTALFMLIYIAFHGAGMAIEDCLLAGFVGLVVGLEGVFWVFLLTSLSGSIVGLTINIFKKPELMRQRIQLGPFLAGWAIIFLLFENHLLRILAHILGLTA